MIIQSIPETKEVTITLNSAHVEILADMCGMHYDDTFLLSIENKLDKKTGATVCAHLKFLKEKLMETLK